MLFLQWILSLSLIKNHGAQSINHSEIGKKVLTMETKQLLCIFFPFRLFLKENGRREGSKLIKFYLYFIFALI